MSIRFMVAAPSSGSGKTIITCAILYILKKSGLSPCAFKCGPDYIDPMFHRSVLGIESHNLDIFLSGSYSEKPSNESFYCEAGNVRNLFSYYMSGGESKVPFGSCVCEGVMGLYDGLGGSSDIASAWSLADILDLPVLLVIRPKGIGLTIAAQLKGLLSFRTDSHIKGIVLNDCSSSQAEYFRKIIEKETGIPVLGSLPHSEAADIGSRHLGLYTAGEIEDLNIKISETAKLLEENCDLQRLFELMSEKEAAPSLQAENNGKASQAMQPGNNRKAATEMQPRNNGKALQAMQPGNNRKAATEMQPRNNGKALQAMQPGNNRKAATEIYPETNNKALPASEIYSGEKNRLPAGTPVRIAVAHDEAFCFMYEETLDVLKRSGAELVFFSPLHDAALPDDIGGLYLPGGYPELHLNKLEKNIVMKAAVKSAFDDKMPIVAECGGFLYLGQSITGHDECESRQSTDLVSARESELQTRFEMCGCLKGNASYKGKPVRFGYNILTAKEDSLLFRKGEKIPSHEFHYFDSTDCGDALTAVKPLNGRQWECGVVSDTLYAGFPHLYMAGRPELAQRFVSAAGKYFAL